MLTKRQGAVVLTPAQVAYLQETLLSWYESCRRDIAWRRTLDPYAIWVSAMMSRYFYVVAFQGAMQVAIIVVMARFATGL